MRKHIESSRVSKHTDSVITALFDILINPALQQEFFCYNVIGRYVPITLKENCNVQDFKHKSGFDIDKGRRF